MPSIVGGVKINSIGSSGVANFGDVFIVAPKTTSKTFSGAGSFVTGDFPQTNSAVSATNTNDKDISDSNQVANT